LGVVLVRNREKGHRRVGSKTRLTMTYRVYSGPKGPAEVTPIEKSQLLFKQFNALDEALSWVRHVERTGRVPLWIEGDDGTRMNRRAIVDALRIGEREQVGGLAD
jgi:hypothetical protein